MRAAQRARDKLARALGMLSATAAAAFALAWYVSPYGAACPPSARGALHLKHSFRRAKLLEAQDGQFQSPGAGTDGSPPPMGMPPPMPIMACGGAPSMGCAKRQLAPRKQRPFW